jgi:hypothetical protein
MEPENVTVLWNGGWDDYLIDLKSLRSMTEDELYTYRSDNHRYFPTFLDSQCGLWLKAWFVTKYKTLDNGCFRVIQHIAGGD